VTKLPILLQLFSTNTSGTICHAELVSASTQILIGYVRLFLFQRGNKYTNGKHLLNNFILFMRRAYHNYWVYILTNKPRGVLYIGVTGGIDDRMERYQLEEGGVFASKYTLKSLVYFEEFQYISDAIAREKQLKNWHRAWKINLVEEENPNWENIWKPLDPETSSG